MQIFIFRFRAKITHFEGFFFFQDDGNYVLLCLKQ